MAEVDDLLAQIKRDYDQQERRRERRRRLVGRGGWLAAAVSLVWFFAAPLFLFGGLWYAAAIWCEPPDPDGGLLRDAEPCRGDDGALLVGTAQVMGVWAIGLGGTTVWARPPRSN